MAANPTSPPPHRPTGHNGTTGPSTTTPMDAMDGDAEAEEQGDVPMRAQSVPSSSSHSTISVETMMDIEQMMWAQAVSPQCSPLVLQQLQVSEHNPINEDIHESRLWHRQCLSSVMRSFRPMLRVFVVVLGDRRTIEASPGQWNSARFQGNPWGQPAQAPQVPQ
eukprot:1818539-Amphidinium_carterae.1